MAARPDFRSFTNPAYRQRAFAARLQRIAVQTHRHTPTTANLTTLVHTLVRINRDLDARLKEDILAEFGLTTDSYLTVMRGRTTPRWVAHHLAELGANP